MACPVVRYSGANVPPAIQASRDWKTRITNSVGGARRHRDPRGWSWRPKLEERAKALSSNYFLPKRLDADVLNAPTAEVRDWACWFFDKTCDDAWALSLRQFDARILHGLGGLNFEAVTAGVHGMDGHRRATWNRNARRWRHEYGIVMPGYFLEGDVMTWEAARAGCYANVPEGFEEFEVPYAMHVDVPVVCLLWGIKMAEEPYRKQWTPTIRGPIGNALWAAFHTQWVMNVAHELLFSAFGHGEDGRLWRLSPALMGAMQQIGFRNLVGGCDRAASELEKLVSGISKVRWSTVSPELSRRPRRNDVGAPVYESGDFVPWDCSKKRVMAPRKVMAEETTANSSERLIGDLSKYRDKHTGRGMVQPGTEFLGLTEM